MGLSNLLALILSFFRRPPAAPTLPMSPSATSAAVTPPPAPPLEETVETSPEVSPAWYALVEPLTKASESCELKAYPDPASGGDPWTCGWGETGPDIDKNTMFTQQQADTRFTSRMLRIGAVVDSLVKVTLTAYEKAALCDFAWNEGTHALETSTLLKLLNEGKYALAADQFKDWNLAAGKIMPGLVTRRHRDFDLFTTGHWK
jgi:lysozyme